MDDDSGKKSVATFGAGCFWNIEEMFRQMPGVVDTAVGFMGGSKVNPTYEEVCTDKTGHVEVVQVAYDSQQTTYDKLLDTFWEAHDPTQLNQQGADVGTQYRSVIFYNTNDQRDAAENSKKALLSSGKYGSQAIATAIEPVSAFYRAEEYHQQYLAKRGQNICH